VILLRSWAGAAAGAPLLATAAVAVTIMATSINKDLKGLTIADLLLTN
jgi:hypothetical protein